MEGDEVLRRCGGLVGWALGDGKVEGRRTVGSLRGDG